MAGDLEGSRSATLSVSYAGTIRIRFKGFRSAVSAPNGSTPRTAAMMGPGPGMVKRIRPVMGPVNGSEWLDIETNRAAAGCPAAAR